MKIFFKTVSIGYFVMALISLVFLPSDATLARAMTPLVLALVGIGFAIVSIE